VSTDSLGAGPEGRVRDGTTCNNSPLAHLQ